MNQKGIIQAVLLFGFFISTVWFSIGYFQGNTPPLSEPDTLIYLQYARNMAEGHPFEFIKGAAPSTGCTSYLYPVLLSLLYKAGCTGNAFIIASFILNAAFFLTTLLLIGLIARRLTPRFYPFVLTVTVISGQTLHTFFGQTDMGLLCMLIWFCFWAFLTEHKACLLAGMLLTGLTHPTSAALAGGLLATGALYALLDKRTWKKRLSINSSWPLWIGCAGVAAIALTLLFNYLITGEFMFMSLRAKGLFKTMPLGSAVNLTLINFVQALKGIFFGLIQQGFRHLYFFPLITGLCSMIGILLRPWNKKAQVRFDVLVILTVLAELALLSTNQQQELSHDRYLAWIIPVIYLYCGLFLEFLHDQITRRPVAIALAGMLIAFQIISLIYFSLVFSIKCNTHSGKTRFAQDIMEHTQPGDIFSMWGGSGIMFHLPERNLFHIFGILTTESSTGRDWLCYAETLKYQPELQPDFWLIDANQPTGAPAMHTNFLGNLIIKDTDAFGGSVQLALHAADWSSLKRIAPPPPANCAAKGRLDVGYADDEQKHSYACQLRLRGVIINPSIDYDKEQKLIEIGQLIIGQESFHLENLTPYKPLQITLRTARKTTARVSRYQGTTDQDFTFSSPLILTVEVDGKPLDVSLDLQDEGFSDTSFMIPAEYITRHDPKITVIGDHMSYAYWFFQPEQVSFSRLEESP